MNRRPHYIRNMPIADLRSVLDATFQDVAEERRAAVLDAARRYSVGLDPADRFTVRSPEEYREEIREARRRVEIYGLDAGHIDHLPGADWHGHERTLNEETGQWEIGYADAPTSAPAPRHTVALWYSAEERTDMLSELSGARRDVIDAAELLRRVQASAKRWTSAGYWDVQDCTSYVLARVLAELTTRAATDIAPPAERGTPRDVLRWIDVAPRHLGDILARQIPTQLASVSALKNRVMDWANREQARRMAELQSSGEDSGAGADDDMSAEDIDRSAPRQDVAVKRAPWALDAAPAERAARALSARIGAGDLGGVWETFYILLRDIDAREGAEELDIGAAAMRQRTSRGAKWIAKHLPTPADLRSALDITPADMSGEAKRRSERGLWRAVSILNAPHIPSDWGDRLRAGTADVAPRRVRPGRAGAVLAHIDMMERAAA